jgi:HPt (histidine-containing phosphotransfer) domain-containing protein
MSRRDLTGAVDFAYLESFAMNDSAVVEEVLGLFREQAALWTPMLDPDGEGWRDALHTIKGAARGVGAFALGDACEQAEAVGAGALPHVHAALDAALFDVAAYMHEQTLNSLRGDVLPLTQRID